MSNSEAQSFLSGKFTPNLLPDVYAPRHKLLRQFSRAAMENRYIFVGAPAGSGKTVSALLWLKACGRKAVWIGIDAYDNIPSVFYKQLGTGLYSLQPDNGAMQSVLVDPDFSTSPVKHTVRLISEMRPDPEPCVLVFDDTHLITNGEIIKSLPAVFRRLPLSFAVLILSRSNLPHRFSALVKEKKLAVITPEELRFTENEIRQYFEDLGHTLTIEKARRVYLETDGWAMGVNIIAKAGQAELGGKHNFTQYFAAQLWDKWEPALRDFCLRTAIVDEFDPELARALSGREDAKEVMEHLLRTNSFLSLLDEGIYRYHHLFQSFLRERLVSEGIDTGELYKTAAGYYKEHGDYARALRFWLDGGDYKNTGDILYRFLFENDGNYITDYADFLHPLFEEGFPQEAYTEFPPLHLLSAWYYYITGRQGEFSYHMDAAIRKLAQIAAVNSKFAECAMLVCSVDHRFSMSDKIKKFPVFDRLIEEYTPGGLATTFPSITHNLPFIHRSSFDHSTMVLEPGSLDALGQTYARLLGAEWDYIRPGIEAGFSYERNQLSKALEQNTLAQQILREENKMEGRVCLLVMQHSILWQMHKVEQAAAVMDSLTSLADTSAQFFLRNLTAYKTKLRLFDGDRETAREWLEQYYVVETERVELFRVFQHFTTARSHMVLNQREAAMKYIRMLRSYGENFNRPLDAAEADVLLAVLLWGEGSREDAAAALESALEILQPFGFFRVVADEGAAVLPVLKRIASKISKSACEKISREFLNEALLAAHAMAKLHKGSMAGIRPADKPVKLSKQQASMLYLLSKGYKNAEIAEITGLAIPTIKSHTSIAYRKLGVHNAMDAVLKARELKLIS